MFVNSSHSLESHIDFMKPYAGLVDLELHFHNALALFSLRKILDFATVAVSFVCGKYYPIID